MIAHTTPLSDWVIVLPVIFGLMGGALLLMLRRFIAAQPWICAAFLVAILASDLVLAQRVLDNGPLSMTMGKWLPPFGISFTADMMGAGFALVAAVVTLAVALHLRSEAPETAVRDGLYPLLLLLLAGVSGAFLTGDLFNLYVWFEVMLIASFGLMVLAGNPLQLDGTVKYGVLNFIATTLFLIALGLLYGLLGTLNMADIIGAARRAPIAPMTGIAALFVLAFGMKAAVFPVNAWLPASYHTPPAAISALLGGLLTKVGVYALLRTLVMLLPASGQILSPLLAAVAVATMLLGPLLAIGETNLRRAVGFLLIGGIGVIVAGVAEPRQLELFGALVYVVHAMLTVTAFYLVAGLVERASGTTNVRNMGGLYAANSLLSLLFLVLVLAMAGVPPFLGFWPKLLLLQGLLQDSGLTFRAARDWLPLVLAIALLGNALLSLIAGSRLWSLIFWRPRAEGEVLPVKGAGAAALLVAVVVLLGLWPGVLLQAGDIAARDLIDPARYIAAVGLAP